LIAGIVAAVLNLILPPETATDVEEGDKDIQPDLERIELQPSDRK